MKISKAENRDKKHHKAKNGMVVTNRSIFTLINTVGKKQKGGK